MRKISYRLQDEVYEEKLGKGKIPSLFE